MEKEIKQAYICFLDVVGYSKRSVSAQVAWLQLLNGMVKEAMQTLPVASVDSVVIPTGDGIALCFWDTPESAMLFALEFNRLLYKHNEHSSPESKFAVRTGIHFGSVMPVKDVLGKRNVVGAGLNIAQRVMDLAAPNQILASEQVYQLLKYNDSYSPLFRSMGAYQAKHGSVIKVYDITGSWKDVPIGNSQSIGGSQKFEPTIKPPQKYAFIIMAFSPDDPHLVDIHNCIKSTCTRRNVLAERVDEIEYSGKITDRIVDCIKRADIIIADLTHERPNVYYEIGLAHGQGIDVVLIARQETKLHFDLSGFNVIFFRNITELTARLEKRMVAILGE